jgi:MYXO-CTERM domain-containing protein
MMPLGPTCLTPLKLAADVALGLPPAEPLPMFAERAVCIDPGPLAKQEQVTGSYTKSRTSDHFYIVWDPSNKLLDEDTLDVVEAALERSWTVMVDEQGWQAPDQTESCLITVILGDLQGGLSGTGGWTNVQAEHGVPFMVLNTDWFVDGDDWVESLIAHEFNHASQFSYNVFWNENDWWYWESTAEWSFEGPYPDANTWTYSLSSYFDAPYRSIRSQVGLVNYGHFTFNVVLAEQVDPEAPLLVWEAADADSTVPTAIDDALGTPISELLPMYTAHVAAYDVAESSVWEEAVAELGSQPFTERIAEYPAEGSVDGKKAPQWGGQSFFHFRGEPDNDVQFRFVGETEVNDKATDFVLTLSTRADDGTIDHVIKPTADGKGQLSIEGLGAGITDAWVGVVPVGTIGEQGAEFTWSARLGAADDPFACGCASASAPNFAAAAVAAGLAVAAGRRRRS